MGAAGTAVRYYESRRYLHQADNCGRTLRSCLECIMKNVRFIVERELRAYFSSPIAYVVLTIFLLLSGFFFNITLQQVLDFSMRRAMQGAQFGQTPPPMDMPGMISQSF